MRALLVAVSLVALVTSALPEISHAEPDDGAPSVVPLPPHPPTIVAGCAMDDRMAILARIVTAIGVGAPVFNAGDHRGCYRVYETAAREIEADLGGRCTALGRALRDGRLRALGVPSDTDRAWAMRYAFDAILDAIETY